MNILCLQHRSRAATISVPREFKRLIRRSIDLRRLYLKAASVSEPGLRLVLSENARTLELLIHDLQAQHGHSQRHVARGGSWRVSTQQRLARWLLHASPRGASGLISMLANRERALLQAFERAIAAAAAAPAALTLRQQLPRLQNIRLDMDILAG